MRTRKRRVGVLALGVASLLVGAAVAGVAGWGAGPASSSGQTGEKGKMLDLVWISDSSGWGAAGFYARHIRQDLKVKVRVQDAWVGGLSAVEILQRLRTPSSRWVSLIRNAEVIVVYGSPAGLEIVKGGDCIFSSEPPLEVGPQVWQKYIPALKAIYKRIFQIRKGAPVIMRTYTMYVSWISHAPAGPLADPSVKSWDEAGITDVCTKKWEWYAWAIRQAAAAYRVPVADVYAAFNGTTHREDPVAKGYVQTDNMHPNDAGRAVIAETIASLGYKPVKPPR